jgi:hypothetical protein
MGIAQAGMIPDYWSRFPAGLSAQFSLITPPYPTIFMTSPSQFIFPTPNDSSFFLKRRAFYKMVLLLPVLACWPVAAMIP